MRTVTVKVDEELRRRMKRYKTNWSEYIREAIEERIELEESKAAAAELREALRKGRWRVPKGFIEGAIREGRERR